MPVRERTGIFLSNFVIFCVDYQKILDLKEKKW